VTVAPVAVTDDTEMLAGSAHLDTGAALADISCIRDAVNRDAATMAGTATQSFFMDPIMMVAHGFRKDLCGESEQTFLSIYRRLPPVLTRRQRQAV
jgi:hypothetical protein